jgi:hypothetical protein
MLIQLDERDLALVVGGGDSTPAPAPKQNPPPKPPPPPPEPRPYVPPVTLEGGGSVAVVNDGRRTEVVGVVFVGIKW